MTRMVLCVKAGKQVEGLGFAPWPGPLGQRIFNEVGKEAWQAWLAHQTMLINENRLNPLDPKTRAYLAGEMEKYFFSGGEDQPVGYVPTAE